MRTDKTLREVLRASLLGLIGILVLGALLLLVDIGGQLAREQSWDAVFSSLSISVRDSAPWAFIAGGFMAGLYLRSLLLMPTLTTTVLANAYVFVLSLIFHAAVVDLSLFLIITQVRTSLIGIVVFGIFMALGSLVALRRESPGALH